MSEQAGPSRHPLDGKIMCTCQEIAALRTSGMHTKNAGRQFFTCPKHSTDPTHCKFFKWANEVSGPGVQAVRPPPVPAPAPAPALAPSPEQSKPAPAPPSTPKKLMPNGAAPPTPVSRARPRDPRASAHRAALIKAALEKDEKENAGSTPPTVDNTPSEITESSNRAKGKETNGTWSTPQRWTAGDEDEDEIRDAVSEADEPVPKRFKFIKQETPGSAYISPKSTPAPSFSGNDDNDDDNDNDRRKLGSPKRKRIGMEDAEHNPFFICSSSAAQSTPDLTLAGTRLKGLERRLAESQRTNEEHEEKIRTLESRILSLEIHTRNLDATVMTLTQLLS